MPATDFIASLLGAGALAPPADAAGALRLVRFHGLEGLAVARDRELGGGALPAGWCAELEGAYRTQALATTLVVEAGQRARSTLRDAGIETVLFKGAALVADGTYGDPGARRMDDADLLVPADRAEAAVRALTMAGFRPVTPWTPELSGWSDALTLHDSQTPAGVIGAVDLHWRVRYDTLRFGLESGSALLEGAIRGVPRPEPHLVRVAEHVLKHLRYKIHLAAFGDLARLAERVEDWGQVASLVAASRLEVGLRALLAALAREIGAPVPGDLVEGAPAALTGELGPAALAGRVRVAEGRLAGIGHRWRLLGRPGGVVEDLVEAAFPPDRWLAARYGRSGPAAWVRYVRDVARWAVQRGRSPASPHQELFDPRARE